MEIIVNILAVGTYTERQYQKQDGTTEFFKSRGLVLKYGGDKFWGELIGDMASKNRDTLFKQNQMYVVKGYWRHREWGENNDRHENAFYITDIQVF